MTERTYLVTWQIDIEADSFEEAASQALIVQRDNDPENSATVFGVTDTRTSIHKTIDLSED